MGRDWSPQVYDREAIRETVIEMRQGQPVERTKFRKVPHVGELVAWRDRKPYRVTAVYEREQANWHEQTLKVWERDGMPDPTTWADRERAVRLQPADDPKGKERHRAIFPWASNDLWWPIRDQYPTCNDCGLIWPCPCDERNDEAVAAMKEFNRLAGILPGCCWACGEPVTGRHHSIVFDGENLLMPGAAPAVFHTSQSRKAGIFGRRGTCREQAEDYEQQWATAGIGREVRLRCAGLLYRHIDSSECTRGAMCPGVDASHEGFGHCVSRMTSWSAKGGVVEQPAPATNCGARGCRGAKIPASSEIKPEAA